MVVGIQIVGLIFALVMIYFSYFYYKRKDFKGADLALWAVVWIIFIIAIMFPKKVDILLATFGILGALQLFTIAAILFLVAVVFYLYKTVRKNQQQVEKLVREIALK